MLPEVNIPGTAIHFDGDSNELITFDYQETSERVARSTDCYTRGYYGRTQPDAGHAGDVADR
jgi:hypothetical protein